MMSATTDSENVFQPIPPLLSFEEKYLLVRQSEKRLYTNEALRQLPYVADDHPHYREWKIRAGSANRLLKYLQKNHLPLNILEVGCGNGWLSNHLASLATATVTGIDINSSELLQAKKVFSHKKNLSFVKGDIRSGVLQPYKFDHIIFAASIQYFPSLSDIIQAALALLTNTGEIHVIDTPFYDSVAAVKAGIRSAEYYTGLGCPEMTAFYFHHAYLDLSNFRYSILYKPSRIASLLSPPFNPFPWICIKKINKVE